MALNRFVTFLFSPLLLHELEAMPRLQTITLVGGAGEILVGKTHPRITTTYRGIGIDYDIVVGLRQWTQPVMNEGRRSGKDGVLVREFREAVKLDEKELESERNGNKIANCYPRCVSLGQG